MIIAIVISGFIAGFLAWQGAGNLLSGDIPWFIIDAVLSYYFMRYTFNLATRDNDGF